MVPFSFLPRGDPDLVLRFDCDFVPGTTHLRQLEEPEVCCAEWPPIQRVADASDAAVDVEPALLLVDLEQRRAFANPSRYFGRLREGRSARPLRDASRKVLADLTEVLDELQAHHPGQAVEERIAIANRQA